MFFKLLSCVSVLLLFVACVGQPTDTNIVNKSGAEPAPCAGSGLVGETDQGFVRTVASAFGEEFVETGVNVFGAAQTQVVVGDFVLTESQVGGRDSVVIRGERVDIAKIGDAGTLRFRTPRGDRVHTLAKDVYKALREENRVAFSAHWCEFHPARD